MKTRTLTALLTVFAIPTYADLRGIATLHETASADGTKIRGTLIFEQKTVGGEKVMQVSGQLTGIPDGIHGFHIHQYGDESVDPTTKRSRYGAHFVPVCQVLPNPCSPLDNNCEDEPKDECTLMSTHGLPPDNVRQSGDMGNIVVKAGEVTTILPQAIKEKQVVDGVYKQKKMTLDGTEQSILGRAVAIHKYEDIGREIPLYDGLCLKTCNVDLSAVDKPLQNGRACTNDRGKVKLTDIYIKKGLMGIDTEAADFAKLQANKEFTTADAVVVRFPSDNQAFPYFYYRVKKIISKPANQDGDFDIQFDNANACARRISANFLKSTGAEPMQKPDDFGAAGPPIAGGVVGRMNPNGDDGFSSTGRTDDTKPVGTSEISCYLRATEDAGASTIGGEVLIVQKIGTSIVDLQYKLAHGANMGGAEYSFHFHDYGDLRKVSPPKGDTRRVGKIYKEDGGQDDVFKLRNLKIANAAKETYASESYTLPETIKTVGDFVGRSLTIHSGPSKESPTVSYGVCGIANPDSVQKFDTTTPIVYAPAMNNPEASTAVTMVPSLVFLVASLLF